MSLKLGTQDIAGISQNKICNAHFLLEPIWSDHIINDILLLRADTFSWQSGDVYVTAYNHLVADIQGITAETETIGSYTVTFYRATDGHKICLADQEQTVLNIYNSYGIAWYYILDTTNTQFKLPRTKYGFEGLRTNVGDKIDESLPNIKGNAPQATCWGGSGAAQTGAFQGSSNDYQGTIVGGGSAVAYLNSPRFDASNSSSTYQDNAPVQERATQMYLYFYVGDYTQTAIEQTAGLNAELFNGKADLNLANTTNKLADGFLSKLAPDYENGITTSFPQYPLSSSTTTFTCPSAGLFHLDAVNSPGGFDIYIHINGVQVCIIPAVKAGMAATYELPCAKDDVILVNSNATTANTYWQINKQAFYPLKGAN